ncbi:GNAT family N-acetyltransferase [Arthrobacter castelli]|uniref:GNAT family N-acetyltransferase n=1 Tax=Arthrobacter castelli TaxID=271431 RepID=UPI00042A660F|nr:GNAT family N-acetyltransferase [Arthrobacter castelli]
MIRAANEEDVVLVHEIERAAGAAFREIGMAPIADDETPPARILHKYQRAGRMWVATNAVGRVVAYLLADIIDGNAHIEQVSVHPHFGRRGFGRALIEAVAAWARQKGMSALTLTTFTHVPWNAPYYERLGFSVIPGADLGPGLRDIRGREATVGLDAWPRVAMCRPVKSIVAVGFQG